MKLSNKLSDKSLLWYDMDTNQHYLIKEKEPQFISKAHQVPKEELLNHFKASKDDPILEFIPPAVQEKCKANGSAMIKQYQDGTNYNKKTFNFPNIN